MRKLIAGLAALSLGLATLPASAQQAPAQPPAAPAAPPAPDMFTVDQLKPIVATSPSRCDIATAKQFRVTEVQAVYELSCAGGYGEVAVIALPVTSASPVAVISCPDAKVQSNFTCTLTTEEANAASLTQRLAAVSQTLASKGFECQANKIQNYAPRSNGTVKAGEVGCANRTDSAVIVEGPAGLNVLNCARAMAEGFRCSISDKASWAAAANADLHAARPATNCIVGDLGLLGQSAASAYLEVTCSDGLLGFLINYPRLGGTRANEAIPCALAAGIGGGCKMQPASAAAAAPASPPR